MVSKFLELCQTINCPVSLEKTEWSASSMVFLGILLDGRRRTLAVPQDKKIKALDLLQIAINKKKVTKRFIQKLMGTLNFLHKAIIPGRVFTRKMYYKLKLGNSQGQELQQHHHILLDKDFIDDCKVWKQFLLNSHSGKLCRPFIDWQDQNVTSHTLNFYSDASASHRKGMGAIFGDHYIFKRWNPSFIMHRKPSIEFLELYTLVAAIVTWSERLANKRVAIFCDNTAVRDMVNGTTGKTGKCRNCPSCMNLIRVIVTESLKWNFRIYVKHVKSNDNLLADNLSCLKFKDFRQHAPIIMKNSPDTIPTWFLDAEHYWNK